MSAAFYKVNDISALPFSHRICVISPWAHPAVHRDCQGAGYDPHVIEHAAICALAHAISMNIRHVIDCRSAYQEQWSKPWA
jgi:hypothetical protein